MIPYYGLLALIVLLGLLPHGDRDRRNLIAATVGSAAIIILQGLRHPSVGVDVAAYIPAYELAGTLDIAGGGRLMNFEPGYLYFSQLFSALGVSAQLYLGIVAAAVMVPIGATIRRYSVSAWLSILLYVTLGLFVFSFSGLRQAIAIGICFFALRFIKDKRLLWFVLAVLLAATFHTSALVFLFAYPLYHMPRFDARWMVLVLSLFGAVYLVREPLYAWAHRIYGGLSGVPEPTGAFGMLLGMIAVYVLAYMFGDRNDLATRGYSNLLLGAIFFQTFAEQSNVVMRAGYYYFIPVILLIPLVISHQRDPRARLLVKYVVVVMAVLFFHRNTAGGYLDVSPYLPFWL